VGGGGLSVQCPGAISRVGRSVVACVINMNWIKHGSETYLKDFKHVLIFLGENT